MVLRYREQLGAAMRRRRIELNLKQKDVAAAAHVKEPQTVSRWERGMNTPSDLEAVAAALQWTVGEMMAGIQPPTGVARKLDITPNDEAPLREQLARMEAKLEEIYNLLSEAPPTDAEKLRGVVGTDGARLLREAASQTSPAPDQPEKPAAAKRRPRA